MRIARCGVAAVLAAGLVTLAGAQPPRQPGGGGGGFGTRGPVQLVQIKAVQDELKLDEAAVEKLKTWAKDFQAKQFEAMKDRAGDFKDLPREEMAAKFAAITAEQNKAAYKDLSGVLKAEQVKRIKQIEWQAAGVNAFQNPEVVEGLKMTDQQKISVKGIVAEYQKDRREVFGGGGGKGGKGGAGAGGFDPEKFAAMQAKDQKLVKEAMGKVVELLDDTQKKAWKDLIGEAFDTAKLNQPMRKKD